MSGPSGVGKSTLLDRVIELCPDLAVSVSVVTRPPREGEADGVDYHFISRDRFEEMVAAGELLEHALYAGHRYGTPREPVDRWLAEGRDVVLEIELNGARQVRAARPDAVAIFLLPPSWEVLEDRLTGRGTEPEHVVRRRLARAHEELAAAPEFDYRVVSDDLDVAAAEVLRIMTLARSRKDETPP